MSPKELINPPQPFLYHILSLSFSSLFYRPSHRDRPYTSQSLPSPSTLRSTITFPLPITPSFTLHLHSLHLHPSNLHQPLSYTNTHSSSSFTLTPSLHITPRHLHLLPHHPLTSPIRHLHTFPPPHHPLAHSPPSPLPKHKHKQAHFPHTTSQHEANHHPPRPGLHRRCLPPRRPRLGHRHRPRPSRPPAPASPSLCRRA